MLDKSGADKVIKIDTTPRGSILVGEYETMECLQHPNIARLYDFFFLAKGAIFAYEVDFCMHGDLFRIIAVAAQRRGQIPYKDMATWFRGVLSALAHLHAFSVVHRDVKPSNILFDHGMRPLLAASWFSTSPSTTYVEHTDEAGTDGFMAPEMLAGLPYGPPADVWSFNRVVNATSTADPHGTTDMVEHDVSPWLWWLHTGSKSSNPAQRLSAPALQEGIWIDGDSNEPAVEMRNEPRICVASGTAATHGTDWAGMERPIGALDNGPAGRIAISAVIRGLVKGGSTLLKEGRASQKRLAGPPDKPEGSAKDKRARNVSRKVRRKVGKAMAAISSNY